MVAHAKPSTPPPPADRVLVLTRVFDAPRELVFKAWSSAEHMANWFGPHEFTLPFCETDFRPGGKYRLCMRGPDGKDYWLEGVYREIVEPQRIVFTWERNGADDPHPGHTLLTVTLDEVDGGKTRLTLHQAAFDATESRDGHRHGWTEALERLAAYVGKL